jgi:hypothetical protein
MKNVIGLLFFTFVISASVSAAEQPGVRYYGYFSSEEYSLETTDHSNLAFLNARSTNALFMAQFQDAINHNMKVMVNVSDIFFKGNNEHIDLETNYQQGWAIRKNQLAGLAGYIAAFYVVDEPTRKGLDRSELQVALNEIKSNFPQTPTAAIFDTDNIDGMVGMFDWVGFDCYDNGNSSCDPDATFRGLTKTRYEGLRSRLDASRQKMILVPQAAYIYQNHDRDYHRDGMESELVIYHHIALTDPLVVAAIPFMWQSGYNSAGQQDRSGLKDMATDPNYNHSVNINLYKDFGRDVIKRANALYPAMLSPTHLSILTTYIVL